MKRQEYRQKGNNSNNVFGGRGRRNAHSQQDSQRENTPGKAQARNAFYKQNQSNQHSEQKYNNRAKAEETVEDIREDIARIEKEIELEIKEIRSLKL